VQGNDQPCEIIFITLRDAEVTTLLKTDRGR